MAVATSMTFPKVEIRQRPGTEKQAASGGNTQLLLNGEVIPCRSFKIEADIEDRGFMLVTMEFYASFSTAKDGDFIKELKVL